jgi:hypothetical protein
LWGLVLLLAGLTGCKGWRVETAPPADLVRTDRPEVVQITRAVEESTTVKVIMYSPEVVGDSLRGVPTELAIRPFTVPLKDIRRIATRHFNAGKTLLMVGAIVGGVLLYDLLMSLNEGA